MLPTPFCPNPTLAAAIINDVDVQAIGEEAVEISKMEYISIEEYQATPSFGTSLGKQSHKGQRRVKGRNVGIGQWRVRLMSGERCSGETAVFHASEN